MTRNVNGIRATFMHAALLLVCLSAAVPFFWMLSTSLKTLDDAMRSPPRLLPDPIRPQNYVEIVANPNSRFLLWTRNTLIIATLSVAGTVVSSALVAYGFARITFPGRGALFALMLATMMIPFPVTMV